MLMAGMMGRRCASTRNGRVSSAPTRHGHCTCPQPSRSRAAGATLVLVMGFEMLLHVVGPGEFFMTVWIGTVDSFLGRVDLGMPARMARRGESLVATVRVTEAAGISSSRALLGRGSIRRAVFVTGTGFWSLDNPLGCRRGAGFCRGVFVVHAVTRNHSNMSRRASRDGIQ